MSQRPNHVCRLTPAGRGALATIAVSGPQAVAFVDSLLMPAGTSALKDVPVGRILFGHWGHARGEEVVVVRREAHCVEVHCHGGPVAVEMIIEQLREVGCEIVAWREWPVSRAQDAIAAAARQALADAATERAALIMLDQAQGALRHEIERILEQLQQRELAAAIDSLDRLLARGRLGLHLATPWRVVVAGAPNVGKSSLINAIVGYQRAIVFDRPGTTRDAVSAVTALDGWPIEFTDTAGLRTACDPVEFAGIEAAQRAATDADLTVLVFDVSIPWTSDAQQLVEDSPAALLVLNKCDLPAAVEAGPSTALRTSALTGIGIDGLIERIVDRLVDIEVEPRMPVPFTQALISALGTARDAVFQGNASLAVDVLSRLVEQQQATR